ncbi:MAG TPA: hypothetical protein VIF09_00685, partial [Polyangiaceae bacterium]
PCTAAACPPVVMAGDLHYPVGLAVDATHLYWIEAGNGVSDPYAPLVRILKSAPCLHATDACRGVLDSMAGGDPFTSLSLAVGPGQACYTQTYNTPAGHSVYCVAFGAGAGTRGIYQGAGAATQVVVTTDTIAWTDFGQGAANTDGALFAVPADAGFTPDAHAVLSGQPGPSALATDGADLVWAEYGPTADAGSVRRVPLDGGGSTLLAAAQASPASVATYAGFVYWASLGDGTVRRVKDDGTGPVETVSAGEIAPAAVYADATGVYWIDAGTGPDYLDGALRRADLAGGNATTMMSGLVNLQAMAVDDVDVYVCNAGTVGGQYHDGTIWQIAKTY